MGINTDITLDSQVVAKYHRIDSMPDLTWDKSGNGKIELALSQYISQEARENGASPINKTFKTFNVGPALTGIIRFILYKAVLPESNEFANSSPAQDGEVGNMLGLLSYLTEAEKAVVLFALRDMLEGKDLTEYEAWYNRLKDIIKV